MRITQLRNATIIVHVGPHHILVDPMLAPKGALPALRLFDGKRLRNPTVELPSSSEAALAEVTHCLITHCQKGHFDHLDRAGTRWLRERQLPVICTPHDSEHLRRRGLNVLPLADDHARPQSFLGGAIRTVRCRHGRGLVGAAMEHGVGYFLEMPGEPSLYLAGDTVLTDEVREFVRAHQPQVCVVPAGGARFDLGGEIIMGVDEVMEFASIAHGVVMANHLEAISHCPVTRHQLSKAAGGRLLVPADDASLTFKAPPTHCALSENGVRSAGPDPRLPGGDRDDSLDAGAGRQPRERAQVQADRGPEARLKSRLDRFMAQPLLSQQGARPAAHQPHQQQVALGRAPTAGARGRLVHRVGAEAQRAGAEIERADRHRQLPFDRGERVQDGEGEERGVAHGGN